VTGVYAAVYALAFLVLAACDDGGPNSEGNNDTIWTGLSGLLILIVVVWLIVRAIRKRS